MKLPIFILFISMAHNIFAADRNLCDDLIDSGTSSDENIKKCLEDKRYGPSEFYREKETNKTEKTIEEIKNKNNIEIKKFSAEELSSAGFGKPFFAIRTDRRSGSYKEKRITEGDALCSYLGYEKALKSVISPELYENQNGNRKIDKQGLIVDTSFFGTPSSTPEIYRDEDFKYSVKKYMEITCLKRKNKDLDDSEGVLKAACEEVIQLNQELNSKEDTSANNRINDNSRYSGKDKVESTTDFGYKKPDWKKESEAIGK